MKLCESLGVLFEKKQRGVNAAWAIVDAFADVHESLDAKYFDLADVPFIDVSVDEATSIGTEMQFLKCFLLFLEADGWACAVVFEA